MINYKKGGKEFKIPEQKKEVDPRSATSFRGKSYLAKGDSNPAKVAKARPAKVTWF
tara:strand:+ start:219 stop:386 length:168 start_codon:yes stop_codon:yes gene_type:complete